MSRLFYALTLVFVFFNYAIAVPVTVSGLLKAHEAAQVLKRPVTPIYRPGAKNDVVGGAVRPQDFHMKDGMVHAHDSKGLSFNTNKHDVSQMSKKEALHSIKPYELKGTDFKAVHDGGKNGNPKGHVSLTYKGENPVSPADLKKKLKDIPWTKERGTKA